MVLKILQYHHWGILNLPTNSPTFLPGVIYHYQKSRSPKLPVAWVGQGVLNKYLKF